MNSNPVKPLSAMATGRSPAPKRQRRHRGHSWSKSKKKYPSPRQVACIQSSMKQSELRQKSTSEKHPSSPVDVAFNDYEHIDDSEYSGTKKSRKLSEIDNPLSASQETPSGQSTPPNGAVTNVDDDTVINKEIPSDMLLKNNEEELHHLEEHQRKIEASANVNSNLCNKVINSALSASLECQTTSSFRKQVNMSTGANHDSFKNASNTRELKMRDGLEGTEAPQSSIHLSSAVPERERLKAPESCLSEGTQTKTQHQPNRGFEDTSNVNEASNQEIPPMIPPRLELMYNEKGTDATSNPLNKELTTINSVCQARKNAVLLAGNNATQEVKSNHLMEEPIQSLDYLYRQDGDMVNDKQLLLLSSPYARSCEFTTDNTALKISPATGSSIPSQLAVSQFSDLQVLFVKRLTAIWSIFEDLDMFKKVPQRPHFLPLQEYLPGLREDKVLQLMFSFATIAESTSKLSIEDSMEVFENNINQLRHLETYGFTVQHLLHHLNKLLQVKSDYTKNLEEKKKLNIEVFKKTWSLAQMDSSHDEMDKAIAEHEMKLGQLRREVQQIAKEKEHEEAELSRLQHACSSVEEACDNEEQQFRSILDELQQKHLTAQMPKLT